MHLLALIAVPTHAADKDLTLTPIGTWNSGRFAVGAAEIAAYDPQTARLFVVNGADSTVDILDLSDPTTPVRVASIDLAPLGGQANSVDVRDGVVAVAIQAVVPQEPGVAAFYDADGVLLASVPVGAIPDMLTFTPDGRYVLVANEGEPDPTYTVDPEGSVSVIDLSGGLAGLDAGDVATADFHAWDAAVLDPSVRVFGPGATPSQDFEPEYVAVDHRSRTAWVTLQENNAFAIVDIRRGVVTDVVGLGHKDHAVSGNGLDPSDRDGGIAIAPRPVRGMYLPDAVATLHDGKDTWVLTANEGDARAYDGFSEETRVRGVTLDPTAFPDASALRSDAVLGRLRITNSQGDVDGDGDYDALYTFGARSFSVWDASGALAWDSGDALEQLTAAALPDDFNATNDENGSFDTRSDDKGPEPEGLAIAKLWGDDYAFVGLERVGGVAVYDLSEPTAPALVTYVNDRDFGGDAEAGTAGDLGPEGLHVIAADDGPTGEPLLVVSNEVSGTVTVFAIRRD